MTARATGRVRILGIAASRRRLSFDKALLHAAVELAPEGVEITTFDRLHDIPHWASRPPATSPLRGKPAGLTGASTGISGTMRAQLALRQRFVFTQTDALQAPEVVLAKCADRFDADLRLTDEPTREMVRAYLERMRDWTGRSAERDDALHAGRC